MLVDSWKGNLLTRIRNRIKALGVPMGWLTVAFEFGKPAVSWWTELDS